MRNQKDSHIQSHRQIQQKIKFTVETELNNGLNFLDVSIIKHNNSFSFDVYRKITFTDITKIKHSTHEIH